ncbi:hypothetical protein DID88_006454 [Monilinia fructigena]|uniref:Uncharacterized protein n=1 Tax=Monilinia fructigena TaxID=38457 RepID=A0A395IGW9_9HELO|nr:hypothetical protein DID88_006454 [Monilinia fructigena]
MSLVWTIPVGIIYATTNIHLGLNVFTEYVIGYMLPGRPVALMLFKTYGYITMNQAHAFLSDLKLAHYLKIPQRPVFWGHAGLDAGLAICTIVIIAALNLTGTGFPDWWGNRAPENTMDYLDTAVQRKVAPGERFLDPRKELGGRETGFRA